jgi:uncharacterized coiled-coil protein SlyX
MTTPPLFARLTGSVSATPDFGATQTELLRPDPGDDRLDPTHFSRRAEGTSLAVKPLMSMTEIHSRLSAMTRIGSQPIVFAAAAFIVIVAGIGAIVAWRSYSGISPEQDRVANGRLVQARVAQASEQLVTKTKDLEATQQQSIDQLQMVQDQLQSIQQMLTVQRTETKRLTDKVGDLTGALDGMRQSFASAQTSDAAEPPVVRKKPAARHGRVTGKKKTAVHARRGKSRS